MLRFPSSTVALLQRSKRVGRSNRFDANDHRCRRRHRVPNASDQSNSDQKTDCRRGESVGRGTALGPNHRQRRCHAKTMEEHVRLDGRFRQSSSFLRFVLNMFLSPSFQGELKEKKTADDNSTRFSNKVRFSSPSTS